MVGRVGASRDCGGAVRDCEGAGGDGDSAVGDCEGAVGDGEGAVAGFESAVGDGEGAVGRNTAAATPMATRAVAANACFHMWNPRTRGADALR
jgi:hypothetical protein